MMSSCIWLRMCTYMWPSMRKLCIMRWKNFWVKATITNYNLWTIAPANLKSLAPCSHGDMSKNIPGSPVLKFCKKLQWTLLRTLHAEVRILAVYDMWPRPPSQWASWTLEWEQQPTFRWKRTRRQMFLKFVINGGHSLTMAWLSTNVSKVRDKWRP